MKRLKYLQKLLFLLVMPGISAYADDHKAVDLGLSVKWATCNVGASSPEEYGDYFAWGETTTKFHYGEDDSFTYNLSFSELELLDIIDADGNLTANYDAATANWGDSWRTPTFDELKELEEECTWTWMTLRGVEGYKVTGPSGNSIFLPAAGYWAYIDVEFAGSNGYYLSATQESNIPFANPLYFKSDNYEFNDQNRFVRHFGISVRPVSDY